MDSLYKPAKEDSFLLHKTNWHLTSILKNPLNIRGISIIAKPRAPSLYRLYKTAHMLDYWLKYTDLDKSCQAILSGRTMQREINDINKEFGFLSYLH